MNQKASARPSQGYTRHVFSPPAIGAFVETVHVVSPQDTADSQENRGVLSLASPVLLLWFEQAAVEFWKDRRDEDDFLLGVNFQFRHLAPSPVGSTVRTRLTLSAADGPRMTYAIDAWDEAGRIADGSYQTFFMTRKDFEERRRRRFAPDGPPQTR